jgi:hypothetical protein
LKILLAILGLLLIALLVVADYKWKQWIAARRRERDTPPRP